MKRQRKWQCPLSDCNLLDLFMFFFCLFFFSHNYVAPEWKKSGWECLASLHHKKTCHRAQQCLGNHLYLIPLNTARLNSLYQNAHYNELFDFLIFLFNFFNEIQESCCGLLSVSLSLHIFQLRTSWQSKTSVRDLATSSATLRCPSSRWRCRAVRYPSATHLKTHKKQCLHSTLPHLAHFITAASLLRLQRARTRLHSRAWARSRGLGPVGLLRFPFSSGRSNKRRRNWPVWALWIWSLRTQMEIRKLWRI